MLCFASLPSFPECSKLIPGRLILLLNCVYPPVLLHLCFSFSVMFFFEPIGYSFVVVGSRNMFVLRGNFVVCVVVGCIVDVVASLTCTVLRSALFSCIFCRFRSLRGKRLSGQGEICSHSVGSLEFVLIVELGELGPCSAVLCTGFFRTMGLLVVYLCKCFIFCWLSCPLSRASL